MNPPIPKTRTLLVRGWRRKCPQCGQGALFKRWIDVNDRCSHCGLQFLTDQGDLWGVLVFADRFLFIIPFVALFFLGLYHPGLPVFVASGIVMLAALIFTMPHRLGLSLALDYVIRRNSGDLSDPEAVSPAGPKDPKDAP
ncbi:MAG TPA: DUF983 domain-containing protein [Dongiaceae bacterium]|nr:DUF983 domain-containing protein [Dongiaceae bacterium]